MFDNIIELERYVGDDEMIGQLEPTWRRDVETIWPWLQENFWVGEVSAGDVAGELAGRVYQIPIVLKLKHRFGYRDDIHLAQGSRAL